MNLGNRVVFLFTYLFRHNELHSASKIEPTNLFFANKKLHKMLRDNERKLNQKPFESDGKCYTNDVLGPKTNNKKLTSGIRYCVYSVYTTKALTDEREKERKREGKIENGMMIKLAMTSAAGWMMCADSFRTHILRTNTYANAACERSFHSLKNCLQREQALTAFV